MSEIVHTDFETIEREDQDYRISTKVVYRVGYENYRCTAKLYKSYNGRILDTRRDMLHDTMGVASSKEEIDGVLDECISECRRKLDKVEDATDISIEVSIDE